MMDVDACLEVVGGVLQDSSVDLGERSNGEKESKMLVKKEL